MSEPDRHHYLPIFYLSQWAGETGKVMRYHRPFKDVVAHPISPKNTGYEDGLYRLDGYQENERNAIEKGFMAPIVDDLAARALRILIERNGKKMTAEVREAWSRFLMSMHVRNPARVEQISLQAADGLRKTLLANPKEYEALRREHDPPTLLEWVEQHAPAILPNFGKQLLPGIITHVPTLSVIVQMHWWVVDTGSGEPSLLTSDRPVYMSHGVADERCMIALPLSPRFIFLASRSQAALQSVTANGPARVANSVNELLATQAEKFVYAMDDRYMSLVKNRLRPKADMKESL